MSRFIAFIAVVLPLFTFSQTYSSAIEYNDFIIDHINELDSIYVSTMDVESGKDYCLSQCEVLMKKADEIIHELEANKVYKGETKFASAAIVFCKYMRDAGKKDLPEFINAIMQEDLASSDEAKILKMADKVDENYDKQMFKFEKAQKAFAKKFDFVISE
jgi:hypothetical protein